jgi:signal transduction histidine kinase
VEAVLRQRLGYEAQVTDETTGRTWNVAGSLCADPGEAERVILVASDITQVLELQASLRRSETLSAMGTLVAGVAHEARNPLFGISANLDALEAQSAGLSAHTETVQYMRQALNRLSALMQQLLDYGKPPGQDLVSGLLQGVIAEAIDACRPLAERAGVLMDNHLGEPLPELRMDRARLVQLFENIIENAVQHSHRGDAVVVEGDVVQEGGHSWIECRVIDRGPGFGKDDAGRVFEPFFTRRRGGTGLGLSIVQRIVQDHGGGVAALNHPGGGAMMRVRLPY